MANPRTRRKAAWAALLLGVLAAVLLVLLWPSPPPPAASASQARQAPPAPMSVAPNARPAPLPAAPAAVEPPPETPGTTPARPPEAPPITLPPTTQPLAEEFYPGTTDWEDVPVDNQQNYLLRILPVRYNVVAPMPIAVRLEVLDRSGARQTLLNPHVRVRSLENDATPWIEVPVRDDGSGADALANDRQYTATLQPDAAQRKALLGRVLVEGSVDFPGVGTRTIPAGLIYTLGPRARLTGHWKDELKDGHLRLEAELEVEEAGIFTLMAQIFGPQMEPIAWVKQTETLPKGRGVIPLQVWGKVLHDSGIDGPYRVRQVLLTRDRADSADYDPGVTVEEAYRTKAYRSKDFSGADWQEPPRVLQEEITAEHPSQRDKPGPLRTRSVSRP